MPDYLLDAATRLLLLEYFEDRDDVKLDGHQMSEPDEAKSMASALRDLKPLREVA